MKTAEVTKGSQAAHPSIGQPAPQFEALSTQGPITLHDYCGSWVILVSQPFDFCPTLRCQEPRFAVEYHKLHRMNCEIIGIDEDDNMSALRWCADAREELGMKLWFPIVPDTENKIATIYGMVTSEHGQLLLNRAIYIIDDTQTLRAIVYYDVSTLDLLDQLIQFVHFLQTTDAKGIVVHNFWQPEWLLMSETIQSSPSADTDKKGDMWYF